KLGLVPNMTRAMANSPAVLDGYLQLSGALGKGTLSAKLREQLSLAIAQVNGCDYCLAAHSAVGKTVGLTAEQVQDSRRGTAVDAKAEALIRFALDVLETRGKVSDATLAENSPNLARQETPDLGLPGELPCRRSTEKMRVFSRSRLSSTRCHTVGS